MHGRTNALLPVRHLALGVQWLHFHVLGVVGVILDALVDRTGPCRHSRERVLVHLGSRALGVVEGGRLHGTPVDWRSRRRLVGRIRGWRRRLVEGSLVVIFGLLVSAPAGRTAAATAATACCATLVAAAETIDYTG